jgi:hypothetical protein
VFDVIEPNSGKVSMQCCRDDWSDRVAIVKEADGAGRVGHPGTSGYQRPNAEEVVRTVAGTDLGRFGALYDHPGEGNKAEGMWVL